MLNTQFPPWPSYTDEEAEAIQSVLLSNKVNYWTGEQCREFEREFAAWLGVNYAITLANGTLALEAALKALDIGLGDEVIVTPRTFFASSSCIVSIGANPVFADVDLNNQNITANTIEPVITEKTKAIIVVHLAGNPADMDSIMALADKHNLYVIEDCAQAHGAKYKGQSVGSIGHIGAWSFCQDKIITTGGEGGMVTTNDEALWEKMWSYKDHGKSYRAVYHEPHPPGFNWLHESFGSNWRMTEMQAAIGRIQLKKMNHWHQARKENSLAIEEVAKQFKVVRSTQYSKDMIPAFYKYYLFVEDEYLANGWSRDKIIAAIKERGIPCYHGACSEIYLEKAFENTSWRPLKRLPNAKKLGETSLMFLVHPTLTDAEISKTCEVLAEVLTEAEKGD